MDEQPPIAKKGKDKKAQRGPRGKEQEKVGTNPEKVNEPKKPEREEEGSISKTPEEQVRDFIAEFKLEKLLPPEFENLNEAQKLKVIQDLKRRIVDIVKSDAQTQYSEDLKKKMLENADPTKWKHTSKIITAWRNLGTSLDSSVTKERDLKNLEGKVFAELRDSEAGKKLIAEDLARLTEINKNKYIDIDIFSRKPYVSFITSGDFKNLTREEQDVYITVNLKANAYANMSYEWGQEKKGRHKKEYDKARDEYDKARDEILKLKESKEAPENKGVAMLEMLQIDNALQMEQLLNTHPEFEKALADFSKSPEGVAWGRTFKSFFTSTSFSKENIGIGLGGAAARWGTRALLGLTTFTATGMVVVAPIIGGITGWYRGKVRGAKTLEEKQRQARYGQRDESKEKAKMVNATVLTNGLEKIITEIENIVGNPVRLGSKDKSINIKEELLSKLTVIMAYAQDQIEKGQVNFGDVKSSLTNQFDFVNNLNKALALKETNSAEASQELIKRINGFIKTQGEKVAGKISEKQEAFITAQARRGAVYGAGFAFAGYTLHWFGEQMHWWGNAPTGTGAKSAITPNQTHTPPINHLGAQNNLPHTSDNVAPKLPPTQPEIKSVVSDFHGASITFEHGHGSIRGFQDFQNKLHELYPDQAKVPPHLQHIMNAKPVDLAKEYKFYDPNHPNTESALIHEHSTIQLDKDGTVSFHDARTGENDILARGDNLATEQYHGNYSGHQDVLPDSSSHPPVESHLSKTITQSEIDKNLASLREADLHRHIIQKIDSAPHSNGIAGNPHNARSSVLPFPHEAGGKSHLGVPLGNTGHMMHMHGFKFTAEEANIVHQDPSLAKFIEDSSTHDLKFDQLINSYNTYTNNLQMLGANLWQQAKNVPANKMLNHVAWENNPTRVPIMKHLHKLIEVTGLKPKTGFLGLKPENTEHYIIRALEKAAKDGTLDKLKVVPEQRQR